MTISAELKEKIESYLSDDELKKELLKGNPDAIRKLGNMSGQKIDPIDVIECYENDTADYLYKFAKRLLNLQELYEELCEEYEKYITSKNSKKAL